MKHYINTIKGLFLILAVVMSCEDSNNVGESQINTDPPLLNDLDIWLRSNFVAPYIIDIQYKWDINETDVERFLHPAFQSNVRPVADVLLKAWIDSRSK